MRAVHRHDGAAEVVVRRVQADGELRGHAAAAEAAQLRHEADGGHGDLVLAEVEAHRVRRDLDGAHHGVEVVERLPCTPHHHLPPCLSAPAAACRACELTSNRAVGRLYCD